MNRAAYVALLAMFVIFGGGLMLAAGEHPVRVVLILGGMLLIVVRGNAIVDRGTRRLGKSPGLVGNPLDFLALTRRDWFELLVTMVAGATIALVGLVASRGEAPPIFTLAPSAQLTSRR
jgi:hypothetical protein